MTTIREQAAKDAHEVLSTYWRGRKAPVDPVKIALDMGIEVYRSPLDWDTSGMIVQREHQPAKIYLAENEPAVRQAFTCAHELGHFVERRNSNDSSFSFVDRRRTGARGDAHEWYANHFAANLLMPQREFLELVDDGRSCADLARHLAVSQSAVRARAEILGIPNLP